MVPTRSRPGATAPGPASSSGPPLHPLPGAPVSASPELSTTPSTTSPPTSHVVVVVVVDVSVSVNGYRSPLTTAHAIGCTTPTTSRAGGVAPRGATRTHTIAPP